jgi:hypothetical protein
MKKECECTDECLGYLTKECKRIEEPKQHVEFINDNIEQFDKAIKSFKQETLEEDKKSFEEIWSTLTKEQSKYLKDYINRQREDAYNASQERSYSEEDLKVAFFEGQFGKYSFNDFFEQFKKK